MKVVERDLHEGEIMLQDNCDIAQGRLLDSKDETYGYYTIIKTDTVSEEDYLDPGTLKFEKRMCREYHVMRIRREEANWQRFVFWYPIEEVPGYSHDLFDDAMKVLVEFDYDET